jgi:hypothetical protein
MQCQTRDEIEQHLSDVRTLAARPDLTQEEKGAVVRAERFAIGLLKEHDVAGHGGGRCPFATEF